MFPGSTPPAASASDTASDTAADLQAENARLRAELESENANLRERLQASRDEAGAAQGLTDEDVRRIEHPEEFADEAQAAGRREPLHAGHQGDTEPR